MVLKNENPDEFSKALANAMNDGWISMQLVVTSVFGPGGFVSFYHAIMQRQDV